MPAVSAAQRGEMFRLAKAGKITKAKAKEFAKGSAGAPAHARKATKGPGSAVAGGTGYGAHRGRG